MTPTTVFLRSLHVFLLLQSACTAVCHATTLVIQRKTRSPLPSPGSTGTPQTRHLAYLVLLPDENKSRDDIPSMAMDPATTRLALI